MVTVVLVEVVVLTTSCRRSKCLWDEPHSSK